MSISRKYRYDVTPDQFYHFVLAVVPIVYNLFESFVLHWNYLHLRNNNLKEIDVTNLNLGNIEK